MHGETTITDLTTGETIVSLQWDTGVNFAHRAGPSWLNNEIFVIGKAYEQGWIYTSMPEGRIGNVFPDLFGLDVQLETSVEGLFSQTDPTTREYHLIALGGLMPSILLYHSELDWVEEIPFKGVGSFTMHGSTLGFSQDGQWMLLNEPVGEVRPPGQIGADYWIRPVDPPGGEAFPLSNVRGGVMLSPDAQRIALATGQSIYFASFPNVQPFSRWGARGYDLWPVKWSPLF